ncbi:hypothetical protein ABIF97_007068 [Bradyrhizobium japonicum]
MARSARWSAAPSVRPLAPGLEIPNAVLGGIPRDDSVVIHERVVVGEPLPPTVVLRPVPNYTEYRYAVVNDRRVIVEPRTRRVVKIVD